jgi:hypothetical protein
VVLHSVHVSTSHTEPTGSGPTVARTQPCAVASVQACAERGALERPQPARIAPGPRSHRLAGLDRAIIAENSGTATDRPRVSPGPDVGGRTAAEALTCTSIARRRIRHPNQTCRRHEGDINPAALALLRSKAAAAVASSVVSERRAQRPPVSEPSTDDHGRCVERRLAVGEPRLTTSSTGGTRCRPTPQLVRLTSARCLQPITRWPARRSSSHASST